MQTVQRKICLVGSFAVGKTSLVRRCVEGRFDDKYLSTIGVKISRTVVSLDETTVKLILWDLAGGDDVLRNNDNYLRGLSGAVIVCDLTRRETLAVAVTYAEKVRQVNAEAALILVGNKADLVKARQIDGATLEGAAQQMGANGVFVASAKTGDAVMDAFEMLAREVAG